MKKIKIGYGTVNKFEISNASSLSFIGGPCAIESNDHALYMAGKIDEICKKLKIKQLV